MISVNVFDKGIQVGDTVRVHSNVVEGNKTRIQIFEGIVLSLSGRGAEKMIKVRKIGAGGVGVEKMWPLNAKSLVKIEVKKKAKKINRAKLYYLRNLKGQAATRV